MNIITYLEKRKTWEISLLFGILASFILNISQYSSNLGTFLRSLFRGPILLHYLTERTLLGWMISAILFTILFILIYKILKINIVDFFKSNKIKLALSLFLFFIILFVDFNSNMGIISNIHAFLRGLFNPFGCCCYILRLSQNCAHNLHYISKLIQAGIRVIFWCYFTSSLLFHLFTRLVKNNVHAS